MRRGESTYAKATVDRVGEEVKRRRGESVI